MLLVILMVKKLLEKELQKANQKEFRIEKAIKRKENKLYVNWKGYDNSFNSWIDKKDIVQNESQFFLKPYRIFGGNINVKFYLSNYATKLDFKNATGVDTCKLAAKSDLASLKVEINKIDADKLKTVPVDLSKLSNIVNNDVVKKTVHDNLVAKVNKTDTSDLLENQIIMLKLLK